MTKRKVNSLIALMALAMLGIIVLQLVWMNNAINVRNELFDRSVNEAMAKTSKRLATIKDVFFVQNMVKPGKHAMIPPAPPATYRFNSEFFTSNDSLLYQYKTQRGNGPVHEEIQIIRSPSSDSSNQEVRVEIIQMDSLITKWEKKIDHNITVMVDNSLDHLENDTTIIVRKRELTKQIDKRAERLKNVAGKMIFESWFLDQDYEPDTSAIRNVLSKELEEMDIPVPFKMGVFYGKNNLIKQDEADSIQLVRTDYQMNLMMGEIFQGQERLAVYFPTRRAFVLKALVVPATLSLIFCSLILLVFGLSIYYIVNQKKISEMKSDFINNMTHEFKTPLATISVATDTIVNPKVIHEEEQIRHFASVIKKENQRMNQQVETILQIARLDKKDFDFNFKVHDVHELLKKSVQINSFAIENRGGKVVMQLDASNPVVTTDGIHMLNVFNNLIDNANKYSPETPEIQIKTRNSDKGVWVEVHDNGIGMSKQVQQKIFEKFYRETTGNIHNVKGFGLGLSYAKAVVDANKGTISVESEPEKGSTFEVFVPFMLGE